MNFEIESPKVEQNVEQEATLSLSLEKGAWGEVQLVGKDSDGHRWYLVILRTDGTIYRPAGVFVPGIQTDVDGRILNPRESVR